jgi:hypothetical protein
MTLTLTYSLTHSEAHAQKHTNSHPHAQAHIHMLTCTCSARTALPSFQSDREMEEALAEKQAKKGKGPIRIQVWKSVKKCGREGVVRGSPEVRRRV